MFGTREIQYSIYHIAVAHPSDGLTNMAHPPFSISLTISLLFSPTAGNTGEVISVTPTTETFLHVVFMQMEVE